MTGGRMSRRLAAALVAIAVAVTVTVPVALATPKARRSFVFYGTPTRAQFVNHADDRQRGTFTNPFNADVLPTPPNANSAKKGARAGDNALFTLKLFSDARLTRPVGTARYSCTVNFGQQAICEGQLVLRNGTMIAMGAADLRNGDLVLPVTGGTGRYAGAHGQLTSTAAGKRSSQKNTQILRFQLV
jgi:hypothetical protein